MKPNFCFEFPHHLILEEFFDQISHFDLHPIHDLFWTGLQRTAPYQLSEIPLVAHEVDFRTVAVNFFC